MSITPYVPPATITSLPSGIWSGVNGLPVLPWLPGKSPTVTKSPLFSTKRATSASGRERFTSYWPYPLWQFELSYNVIKHNPTQPELFTMLEFFNSQQGQFSPWLFVDPSDNQVLVTAPMGFGTGDGVSTKFQITRNINSWVEPVYDVFNATILDNGGAAGTHTIGANGVVTFTTPPVTGHALSWYGYFYFGCHFMQDNFDVDQIVQTLWSGKSLKFRSIRA